MNKHHTLNMLTVTLGSLLMASSLMAAEGMYYSVSVGQSTLGHEIKRNTGTKESASISTRAEDTDFAVNFAAGYQLSLGERAFVALEGFYSIENAKTLSLNNKLVTEVSLNAAYGAKLKPGVMVTDGFSVFASLGVTVLDFDVDNAYTFAPPMRTASERESVFSFGFGAEYKLNDHVSVIGEVTRTQDVTFDPIPEVAVPGKINRNDLDLSTTTIGIAYRF